MDRYRLKPGDEISLDDFDPDDAGDADEEAAHEELAELNRSLAELQERLYAEDQQALLIVLQGVDAAGKDSTVKHVFRETNPQGCRVYAFKEPSEEEAAHDFLWRAHRRTPARGMIHLFNRSHYEDVLVVRVRDLEPEDVWRPRYESINAFERTLANEGTRILKFFLHISPERQLEKFRERLERRDKYWKFNKRDLMERAHWDEYMVAYEDMLNRTTTDWAPWHVIPADHRWYRNLVVARAVVGTLEAMDPRYPEPDPEVDAWARDVLAEVEESSRSKR